LREWREYRDLSLEEAADRMEVHYSTLSRVELNKSPYNQDFLERIAHAYGCEPIDLLTLNPLAPDPPRLVYNRLKSASPEIQRQAMAVIEALLKTGT
jgi:transcriptional regulator with XRE-family HTH domain